MLKAQQKIQIMGPVGQLDTIIVPPKGEVRGIAIVAHPNPLQGGTHTNKVVQTCARALSGLGFVALCPNLRGVGESEGEHDFGRGEVDDILAVMDAAKREYGDKPLILAGFSFGGFVMSHVRERVEADHLILIGPAVDRYEMQVANVPENTLVIHGEHDEVIALSSVLKWAAPQELPIIVYPDAGHFFHGKLIGLGKLITQQLIGRL